MAEKERNVDELAILRQVPLFGGLADEDLANLRSIMSLERFEPGTLILREGDPGDSFYVITEGQVHFLGEDADGRELILDEAGRGEFFGELSILTDEPRAAHARVVEPLTTLVLDRGEFLEFLERYPQAAIEVVKVLGRRLHRVDHLLRETVSRNVNEVAEKRLTFGDRVADHFAALIGSWRFIIVQSLLLLVWIALNVTAWIRHWDPYPFILLNLALSFQAAYAGPIIMMSQNRAAAKDRLAAEIDHQVNLHADMKVALVIQRLDELDSELHRQHTEHCATLRSAQLKQ